MRNEERGRVILHFGSGGDESGWLRVRFESACCCDVFECVGDACGVGQQFLYTESVSTKGVD